MTHPAQPTIDRLLRLSEQAWQLHHCYCSAELSARAYALHAAADLDLWEGRLSARQRRMLGVPAVVKMEVTI